MALTKHFPAVVALLLAGALAAARADDGKGEWVSYRDAYRAMLRFEKYGKAKHFIQNHYQVMPRDRSVSTEGLRLTLNGKTTRLDLPVDATGRAVLPLLKSAYDENAELNLNRKAGLYFFQPRVSIVIRPDGVYEAADLRSACEQALNYQRYADAGSLGGKKCVGVRFAYAKKGNDASVSFRQGERDQAQLPAADGAAFADDPNENFKTVTYRFADWPEKGQVISQNLPVAIAALFE